MKKFSDLTGYNSNRFCKYDHVFIEGRGCFCETPELARKNNRKTGNEVGLFIEELLHEGVAVYREMHTNVWD